MVGEAPTFLSTLSLDSSKGFQRGCYEVEAWCTFWGVFLARNWGFLYLGKKSSSTVIVLKHRLFLWFGFGAVTGIPPPPPTSESCSKAQQESAIVFKYATA